MSHNIKDLIARAPEGATHYYPEDKDYSEHWIMKDGDKFFFMPSDRHDQWTPCRFEHGEENMIKLTKETKSEWNGEGLPPVGIECEHKPGPTDDGWFTVKILAHTVVGEFYVAVFQDDTVVSYSSASMFRPIRTPEQIKTQYVESMTDKLVHAVMRETNLPRSGISHEVIHALVNVSTVLFKETNKDSV